jgi:hypothetical protein
MVMSLLADQTLDWTVFQDQISVWSAGFFTFGNLAAYQIQGSFKSIVPVKFVQVNQSSFQPVLGSFDSSLPVVIEFGDPYCSCLGGSVINIESDNSMDLAGAYSGFSDHSFVAKARADGTPVLLSLFDNVRPSWLVADQKGDITVGGSLWFYSLGTAPVTADAPLATPARSSNSSVDAWLGRFDSAGKLVSATYTGFARAFALDADGSVYFGTPSSVNKWVPGQSHFVFSAPVANVIALATNQGGELAFAAYGGAGEYTTARAVNNSYEGPWTEYVGKLNRFSGAPLMATYLAVIGSNSPTFTVSSSLALAPGGGLWLASDFRFSSEAAGHTLVGVSGDGTRLLDAEALYGSATVSFDSGGNTLVVLISAVPNAPTSLDAAVSVPCGSGGWYFMKRGPDGSLLYASYLNVTAGGSVVTFDGPERPPCCEKCTLLRSRFRSRLAWGARQSGRGRDRRGR